MKKLWLLFLMFLIPSICFGGYAQTWKVDYSTTTEKTTFTLVDKFQMGSSTSTTDIYIVMYGTGSIICKDIKFSDGTVQVSSPTAGGGGGSGSDETALIRSTYNATGKFRQLFFAGGATLPSGDNAGTYEGALIQKNEYQVNNSSRPIYVIVYTSHTERFAYWEQDMDDNFDLDKDVSLYIEFYSAITSSSVYFNVDVATMTNLSTRTWTRHNPPTTQVSITAYSITIATLTWTNNSAGFIAGSPYGLCLSREESQVDALGDVYVLKCKLIGWKRE